MEYKTIICPDCDHEWKYRGAKLKLIEGGKRVYVTCPTCRKNIKIEEDVKK